MLDRNGSKTSAARRIPTARRFRIGRGSKLALLLCGLVVALVAAPSASADCVSLRNVQAFTGHVTEVVGAAASGEWPDGGSETIQLGHVVHKVHLTLLHKTHTGPLISYDGPASGGNVEVDDLYSDSSNDYAGEITYNGPVMSPTRAATGASGSGGLGIAHDQCKYKLNVGIYVRGKYQGDPEVDLGHWAWLGAFSSTEHLPDSLYLHGEWDAEAKSDFPENPQSFYKGALSLSSPWMPDLELLLQCNSPVPNDNCYMPDAESQLGTPSSFSWHLRPVFKK
jgi:hypothetical protein